MNAMRTLLVLFATVLIQGVSPIGARLAHAAGATWYVTNLGQDSSSCGSSEAKPCRTISQAIENAAAGDIIMVGAGRYGSISGDPNFGGAGDEHAANDYSTTSSFGQGCIVCISKAVHIYSLHGASVTVIAGIPSTNFNSNVLISTDGVVFGAPGQGFTITGGNANGLTITRHTSQWTRNVTVSGNIDVNDGNGFAFSGLPFEERLCGYPDGPPDVCKFTAVILLSGNQAVNNGTGFNMTVNADWSRGTVLVESNVARGAGTGFAANPGYQDPDVTFGTETVSLIGNVASGGGTGFTSTEAGPIEHNTAIGNSTAGFFVNAPAVGELFYSNSAIGNGGPGVIVNASPDPMTVEPYLLGFANFTENNFWANDRNRPKLFLTTSGGFGLDPGPSAHCGVLNVGALTALNPYYGIPPTVALSLHNNYWGSMQGPQSSGPGDTVGGVCDQNGGSTKATPFATDQFAITSLN